MELGQIKHRLNSFLLFGTISCLFLLWSCGGGNSASDGSVSGTGALNFSVVHRNAASDLRPKSAVIDCAGLGVAIVEAKVYDADNAFLAGGGPWDCDAGQGTITSVPAGSDRTVVVSGKNGDGYIVFRGEKSDINVVADSENNAGTIYCNAFITSLLAPLDNEVIEEGAVILQWEVIAGAAEYRMLVSQNSDMSNPVINDLTTEGNYTLSGYSSEIDYYYWQVFPIDSDGNRGIGSQVWSFMPHANTSPVAQISIPTKGSTYIVGEEQSLSGSGNDSEDGVLNGASLVWTSNVAGQIGTGEMCSSKPLEAGTHKITLSATDSQNATGTDTVVITVATGRLPDTGQSQIDDYSGTDGEDMYYTINPPAYTKLDDSGSDLEEDSRLWVMIRDDVTGLIWEVKTVEDDTDIHNKFDKYSWQNVQIDFIDKLNNSNFGGFNDWRLPTVKELATIVHKGKNSQPSVNLAYFPNTMSDNFYGYWSSTNFAQNLDRGWYVDFGKGSIYVHDKSNSNYVRAVYGRKNKCNLVDNGDFTVTDTATGLMWQQFETGAEDLFMNWENALKYCEELEHAGYDDWRLPNANELGSIVDLDENTPPSIDKRFFPNTESESYWSSTTYTDNTQDAWKVDFYDGYVGFHIKGDVCYVRAVRGGK